MMNFADSIPSNAETTYEGNADGVSSGVGSDMEKGAVGGIEEGAVGGLPRSPPFKITNGVALQRSLSGWFLVYIY